MSSRKEPVWLSSSDDSQRDAEELVMVQSTMIPECKASARGERGVDSFGHLTPPDRGGGLKSESLKKNEVHVTHLVFKHIG